jgi:hypothetical protein
VYVAILVGQVAYLKIVKQFAHLLFLHQQGRHHHQGSERLRHPFGEVKLRQGIRLEEHGNRVVNQVHRTLGDRQQQQQEGQG